MAGIVQLPIGGSAPLPAGAVRVKLSTTTDAELVLLDDLGAAIEPQFRKSATELVVVPSAEILVSARSPRPFPAGARIGVALGSPTGAGNEVVRPAVEVGGLKSVALVRLTPDGLVADANRDARGAAEALQQPWMKPGAYSYHVNHEGPVTRDATWSLVLDASASVLVPGRRAGWGRFLESLIGVVAAGLSDGPQQVLLATEPIRDVAPALEAAQVDWHSALGSDPAPWPRVTHALEQADVRADQIVVVLDGVPIDYRELTAWAERSTKQCYVVAVGQSRFGITPQDQPSQFWNEELAALESLAALRNVTVVGVTDLWRAAEGPALADALFAKKVLS